jgi:ketosteroid isomerase-like protein
MKKTVISLLLGLGAVTALPAFAATPAALSQGVASAEQAQVLQAIDAWRQAVVDLDRAGLERAYHDELVYGHTDGKMEDKKGQIDRTVVPGRRFTAVDVENLTVNVRGDHAVVTATYTFHIQPDEGAARQSRLPGLDVWTREGGQWQLIGRQLTRTP